MALSSEQIESLWAAYENEAFRLLGYDSFEQYCQIQFNISLSYAVNVMENGRYVKEQIPIALRWAIWERDDFKCYYCGQRQFLSVDHILPESQGGTLESENLLTACMPCNRAKGTKSFEEFTAPTSMPEPFLIGEFFGEMFSAMMDGPFMQEEGPVNYSTGAHELVVVPLDEVERWTEDDQFQS